MPLGECFLGASRCPRCARAEQEGNPVVDRHGTMHAPEKMRNPCHGRRGNIGLPTKTGSGDLHEWKGRVDRRAFEKRLMSRWPDLSMDDGTATILYYSEKVAEPGLPPRHVASWEGGVGWIFNLNYGTRSANPSLLLLGNPPVMLLRKEDRKNLPPLYSQEHNPDPTVWVKLFTPYSSFTFFILEYDQQDTMFGWTDPGPGGDAELGYISLGELAALKGPMGLQGVERDRSWRPTPLSKVKGRQVNPSRWRPIGRIPRDDRPVGGSVCSLCRRPLGHDHGAIYEKSGRFAHERCIRGRRANPSAPSRIKNAWEKFHMKGFTGKVKEISDIPGAPDDLMALGIFVDAVTDDGQRWKGGPNSRLCYEPSDKSLWVIDLDRQEYTGAEAKEIEGRHLVTVAYRTFGDSGKDHAVYEHRFHRPLPTVEAVHPRATLLQAGRYVVTDWIRR